MGNQQTQGDQFQKADWELVKLWRNRRDHQQHIEMHRVVSAEQKDIDNLKDFYIARKNHSRWVAALFFKEDDNDDFCSSRHGAQIYIERIPVRLCDLAGVTFPAALHLYDQALHGYYEFARKLGCFDVHGEFMGLNQRGVFKVWAGTNWSQIGAVRGKISQQDMVHSIIDQIESVVDKSSMPLDNPSIRNFIYRTSDKITFENAIEEFKNYVRLTNGGEVPNHIDGLTLVNDGAFRPTQTFIYTDRMVGQYPLLSSQVNNFQGYPVPLSAQEGITTFRRVQNASNQQINRPPSQLYQNSFRHEPQVVTRRSPFAPSESSAQVQLNQNRVAGRPNLPRLGSYDEFKPIGREQFTMFSPQHVASQPQFFNQPNIVRPNFIQLQNPIQQVPVFIPQQYQVPTSPQAQGQQIVYQNNRAQPIQQFPPAPLKLDGPEIQSQNIPIRPAFGSSRAQITPPATPTMRGQNSIIMQLYTSHDNKAFNPNAPVVGETKHFNNNVKRTESIQQQQGRRFDSVTIINEGQPGSIQGIPSGQIEPKFATPTSGNKNLHLKSIEEVNTEHYWKNENDYSYRPSTPLDGYSGSRGSSKLEPSSSFQSATFNNASFGKSGVQASKYITISEDDGKSSPDFLRKLKEIGSSPTNAPKKYDYDKQYNYSFKDEKKKTSFADNYYDNPYDYKYSSTNNYQTYTSTNVENNFNRYDDFTKKYESENMGTAEKAFGFSFKEEFARSAQSKTGSVLNEYLPARTEETLGFKTFQDEPTYKVDLDPEILADLQKYK